MLMYLVVFLSALVVDLIPIIAPPAWTIMVFLLVKFHLNPWFVLVAGVTGSAIGRYIFSLYVPPIADKLIKRRKKDELEFMGRKLAQGFWKSWLFVFVYTLTPLSSSALFTAAAISKVRASRTIPPFFCGKLLSDALMIVTGQYAAGNFENVVHGTFSLKGILVVVLGLAVVAVFLFIDWRALLQRKKFAFNFHIWR